ncbi:MAG TPA: polyprenyl diphosphate synthase [Pirellulaceae bacterium]|nr:polyprenyl diphosphate synthase [Pirellulaceae bacterium]
MIETDLSQGGKQPTLPDVPRDRIPRHIAMIMDGNGRWAQRQGLPRVEGHRRGAETVRRVTEECVKLGVEQLTLYCLSSENWKRPREELDFLLELLKYYLQSEQQSLIDNGVRLRVIGRLEELPGDVAQQLEQVVLATASQPRICVCLAINYGGRDEIVRAARKFSADVSRGERTVADLDERLFSEYLDTKGMPDPDLLIRTAGEWRVSNYLLWQISYSEIWVSPRTWPEFDATDLHDAIRDYASRQRRFGGLTST